MCSIPDRIRIAYWDDFYTDRIGRHRDGLFMAFVVAAFVPDPRSGKVEKCWYAILHLFDPSGAHVETHHWLAGSERCIPAARTRRDEMIAALKDVTFCDIEVGLFKTTIDGNLFGLIDTSDEQLGVRVTLQPNDFLFTPPWTGTYCT